MTAYVTSFVPVAPIYPFGTINVVYPYGTVQLTFDDPLPAVLILNNNDRYEEEADKFDISYGNSFITITNKTGSIWPVGTRGLLQVATPEEEGGIGPPGPPGADSGSVDGILALRALSPIAGKTLHLNYHTSPGDLGGGEFYGVTTGGPYTDNDGTVIVPGGGSGTTAWLRVWDGIECHVGWWGAKCDHAADDYAAIVKALSLFTNGRNSVGLQRGVINFGPGCNFSQPLYIVAEGGYSIRLKGNLGQSGHIQMGSYLKYTGPAVYAAITFQACDSGLEDLNVYPGLAYNGVHATSDNTINTTTTHAITAGSNVVVTPAAMTYIQIECAIMIDAGGPNLEIVYVTAITATTFTADFRKNHASGVQVGHGPYSSGLRFRNCIFTTPYGPVPINTTTATSTVAGNDVLFTTNQAHNIRVGMPIRVDSRGNGQTLYVKTVPSTTTFTADVTLIHASGVPVKYASAGFLMGNRPSGTVQVSEVAFETVTFRGDTPGYNPHAGFRQHQGGNVKNVLFTDVRYAYLDIAFEATGSSGVNVVNQCIGACADTIFRVGSGQWTVSGLEDESDGAMLMAGGAGSNPCFFNLLGASLEYRQAADDTMITYGGAFTAIGCYFGNSRAIPTSYCRIQSPFTSGAYSSAVTLIDCHFANAVEDSPIVWNGGLPCIPGSDNVSKVTILNCTGGQMGGGDYRLLHNILPIDSFAQVNGVAALRAMAIPPYVASGRRTLHLNWHTTIGDSRGGDFVGQSGGGVGTYVDDGDMVIVPTGGDGSGAWLRTNYLQKTVTGIDPPSMAAGTVDPTVRTPLTIPGAALGDLVEASFSLDLQGAVLRAWVSAADTVKYQFSNPAGGSTVDLGSGTVKCRVKK